jgi:hypothetical protein
MWEPKKLRNSLCYAGQNRQLIRLVAELKAENRRLKRKLEK